MNNEKKLSKEKIISLIKNKFFQENSIAFIAIILIALFMIVILVSRSYFSFLETQLFEERKKHIIEFTDEASKVLDNTFDFSWKQIFAYEQILRIEKPNSQKEIMDTLHSFSGFTDKNDSVAIVIDKNSNYYTSDYNTGQWIKTEMLSSQPDNKQQRLSLIPYNKEMYFLFMMRLEEPIIINDNTNGITHIAIAANIESINQKISVDEFKENCYAYLVSEDGKKLYKYTKEHNFIEENNIFTSFKNYTIIKGGDYDDFIQSIHTGKNTALEFEFENADGVKENWFIANAVISAENWHILLFLPTKVLGANTALLMNRTAIFFIIVSIVLIAMLTIIIIVTMISRADKKLMLQKDEANKLLSSVAEEAENANKAKSDFLSHMSHDIRTPINGIMGMTDIALKNINNKNKVLDCLHKIDGSSQHLLSLINDVLDMSRIESGKTKANHEKFDMRACIENCASIIDGQLSTRDVKLIRKFDKFDHPILIGDELHLRQIFINILGNSVKFTPDGGKIYFRVTEKENFENKSIFRFEIEDTGIGMKADYLPHLFEAFTQEDEGTRTTYKGTGLGMAITKQFVDLMGGNIDVESELNVGTKFVIEIPIDIDENAEISEEEEIDNINIKGMKILLVEDNELNMEIAQSILESEGAVITPVFNGKEALNEFVNNPPKTFDTIIMDIMMPIMDGITATKLIRASDKPDAKTIPIAAMTANAYKEDIIKTKEAGMNAHLSKPIDVEIMLKALYGFYKENKKGNKNGDSVIDKPVDLTGLKALLVEDVELNMEIAQAVLEEIGVIATPAVNGKEAVEAFINNPKGSFDVILMDMNMPVMDGITATKTIRSLDRDDAKTIPIVAMTANAFEEDIQKTKAAGMNEHLTKPLDVGKLIQILSKYKKT